MRIKNDLYLQCLDYNDRYHMGVSLKVWHHLWQLKGLRLTRNWIRYRRPTGSWIFKKLLDSGRIRDNILCLRKISIKKSTLYLNRKTNSLWIKRVDKIYWTMGPSRNTRGKDVFMLLLDIQRGKDFFTQFFKRGQDSLLQNTVSRTITLLLDCIRRDFKGNVTEQ